MSNCNCVDKLTLLMEQADKIRKEISWAKSVTFSTRIYEEELNSILTLIEKAAECKCNEK